MERRYYPLILILLLGSLQVTAQKIKYKDVFPLLEAKNYTAGKAQLDLFLANPKNVDHPNANLQLGLYYEQLIDGYDFIADSSALIVATDSAAYYFARAKGLIVERELKKNDEYYQAFYRRDLRTGDFGIKISDVHLDIEKKIAALQKLSRNSRLIYSSLNIADRNYTISYQDFNKLATAYETENDFLLMSVAADLEVLQGMVDLDDSIRTAYENLRDGVSRLNKKGYSPEIEYAAIENFSEDGRTPADFYQNDIKIWDYSDWASGALKKIKREVTPLKENLLTAYNDLKATGESIKLGENLVYTDLPEALESRLSTQLRSLDEDPLPEKLLNIIIESNRYSFITNSTLNPRINDTEDVSYQLSIHDSLRMIAGGISAQLNEITEPVINQGVSRYKNFIQEAYGGDFGLIKYRNRMQEKFSRAEKRWTNGYAEWLEKSHWAVSEDLQDSVYLLSRADSSYRTISFAKYYTIGVTEGDSSNLYVIGLEFTGDSDKGFAARIANNRTILWKENFDLGKFKYSDYEFLVSGGFVETEENKLTAFIYSEVEGSENNFIILNANYGGGINWSNALKTPIKPIDIKFNNIIKETIVYLVPEEEIGLNDEEPGYIVIDRSGKVR